MESCFPSGRRIALAEISLEETLERFAVAGFVASHLMNRIVDGVEAEFLGYLGEFGLAFVRTSPSISAKREAWSASSNAAFSQ